MKIFQRISNLLGKAEAVGAPTFRQEYNSFGLELISDDLPACRTCTAPELLQHQYVTLRMLVEQGAAIEKSDRFIISTETVIRINQDEQRLLMLPGPWRGGMRVKFDGITADPNFALDFALVLPNGDEVRHYKFNGPLLRLSDNERYIPSQAQWEVFQAVKDHKALPIEKKTRQANLLAVKRLEDAQRAGAPLDLAHFDNLRIEVPNSIGLSLEEDHNGDLLLTPEFQEFIPPESLTVTPESEEGSVEKVRRLDISPGAINSRVHQLSNGQSACLNIGDTIVVLDEKRLEAVREILNNRRIPAKQVRQFLKTPGAFIDASLVNLDTGFSIRVKGATVFKPAYFGDSDASGISWMEGGGLTTEQVYPISRACEVLNTPEEVDELESAIGKARDAESNLAKTSKAAFILSGTDEDYKHVEAARNNVHAKPEPERPVEEKTGVERDSESDTSTVVLDIVKMDEEEAYKSRLHPSRVYRYESALQIAEDKRKPFPYQEDGIRWMLGIATNNGAGWNTPSSDKENADDMKFPFIGALLADDMGLGKTYMALRALAEYLSLREAQGNKAKPALVVAPLSLLENWKCEVEQAFSNSPFSDIVVLQRDADLRRFTHSPGKETKQNLTSAADTNEIADAIRFSLKVGPYFGRERLDTNRRLVLATYQALRDYQFSLARVDWSFIILDEAQNIKNPNALQSIAAKGLKAEFRVVATGTPVENSLVDFWSLWDTAISGLLGTHQQFRKRYISPIKSAAESEVSQIRYDIGKQIRDAVGNLMLRRTKEEILTGLPAKVVHNGRHDKKYSIEMTPRQREIYEGILATVANTSGDKAKNIILSALHSLRDVSLHPALTYGGTPPVPTSKESALAAVKDSAKLILLLDILDEIKARKEKVIIFIINRKLQAFLEECLKHIYGLSIERINGDTKAVASASESARGCQTRRMLIQAFEDHPGFNIIIMSPIAAGVGLTIVGANNVIHLERHWNPAKENQATDRVYRIGQTRQVNVYIPTLTHPELDSFDINLDSLLSRKLDLKDAIITPHEVGEREFVSSGVFGKGKIWKSTALKWIDVMGMGWEYFEALVSELVEREFHADAMLTPKPNDWGADVVAVTEQSGLLVQCKHQNQPLSADGAVLEVYKAKPKYEKSFYPKQITKLLVATSAKDISSKVRQTAKEYNVILWDGNYIESILGKHEITHYMLKIKLESQRFSPTMAGYA